MQKCCYNCKHSEMNKFYEHYCHFGTEGLFTEDGIPKDSSDVCDNFEEKKEASYAGNSPQNKTE